MTLPIDLTTTLIAEDATFSIAFTVRDHDGQALGAAQLDSLTLTLFDEASGSVINGREGTDILNTNGGTLDAQGEGAWTGTPADAPIVGTPVPERSLGKRTGRMVEDHIALFAWTWDSGAKQGRESVRLRVVDLDHVPAS